MAVQQLCVEFCWQPQPVPARVLKLLQPPSSDQVARCQATSAVDTTGTRVLKLLQPPSSDQVARCQATSAVDAAESTSQVSSKTVTFLLTYCRYFASTRRAKYCHQHVCLSVCLSVCWHVSKSTCPKNGARDIQGGPNLKFIGTTFHFCL